MRPSPPEQLLGTNSKVIIGQSDGLAERINQESLTGMREGMVKLTRWCSEIWLSLPLLE
jgi:hypothetical protein